VTRCLLVCMVALVIGCSTETKHMGDASRVDLARNAADRAAANAEFETSRPGAIAPPKDVLAAVSADGNAFALELYSRLRTELGGNQFFSPYSIHTALAMTFGGARGETATEMARVLRFNQPPEKLHTAIGYMAGQLNGGRDGGYRLNVANRLWGQRGTNLQADFLTLTRDSYGAELAQVDFQGQTEQARAEINRWVSERTADRVPELVPTGMLSELTRMVLTNAIYFKGNWTSQFDPQLTHEAPFRSDAQRQAPVPLMHQTARFGYAEHDGLQVLELPYVGGELSMIVLLPTAVDGLAAVEDRLTTENLAAWTRHLAVQEVKVYLPRFKLDARLNNLAGTLQSLGMTRAFSPGDADFSGINGGRDLFLSAAIHQAFVDVNEEGTEAAAATAIVVNTPGPPPMQPVFRVDHPFLFLIRDRRWGNILFMGRVVEPPAQ
jgi:serpin B